MKNVVITGANGFVGSNLCKYLLKRNINVYAFVRSKGSDLKIPDSNLLTIIEKDLNEYNDLKNINIDNIDVFYHFAWECSNGPKLADYRVQTKNIENTCQAIELAKKINTKKFIFAGTINEYELSWYKDNNLSKLRSSHIYAISKMASDYMCKVLAKEYQIQYNKAILGSIFGPGDKSRKIHNVFIKSMLEGICPLLTEGESLYDWVYIDDAVRLLYEIGTSSINFKDYYIGHNVLKKFKDYLVDVRDILNPNLTLIFGSRKDDLLVNYENININSVYEDTGIKINSNFVESIMNTVDWINSIDFKI